jgi:hypothetical protein
MTRHPRAFGADVFMFVNTALVLLTRVNAVLSDCLVTFVSDALTAVNEVESYFSNPMETKDERSQGD